MREDRLESQGFTSRFQRFLLDSILINKVLQKSLVVLILFNLKVNALSISRKLTKPAYSIQAHSNAYKEHKSKLFIVHLFQE